MPQKTKQEVDKVALSFHATHTHSNEVGFSSTANSYIIHTVEP